MKHRQGDDARASHELRHRTLGSVGEAQLAEAVLDADLPRARGRQQQFIGRLREELPSGGSEALWRGEHPQPGLRIEENPHFSKALRRSLGSGASKSSATKTRPFSVPRERSCTGAAGTSRATGTPDLAMITSSPAATRSRRLERWVLASWTLYFGMGNVS